MVHPFVLKSLAPDARHFVQMNLRSLSKRLATLECLHLWGLEALRALVVHSRVSA